MTEQNVDYAPRRITAADVVEFAKAAVSLGCVIAAVVLASLDHIEMGAFLVLIAIWIEVGG